MENPIDLSGKVAIVTGGGKGVGKGITERLLEAGAQVMICGRTEPEQLPCAGQQQARFQTCDVRDVEQIEAFVDYVVDQLGRMAQPRDVGDACL